jgi:hypothetical protein
MLDPQKLRKGSRLGDRLRPVSFDPLIDGDGHQSNVRPASEVSLDEGQRDRRILPPGKRDGDGPAGEARNLPMQFAPDALFDRTTKVFGAEMGRAIRLVDHRRLGAPVALHEASQAYAVI